MLLATSILSLFASAAVAPAMVRLAGPRAGSIAGLVPAAWFAWFAAKVPAVRGGGTIVTPGHPWVPGLDLHLAWRLDGLSLLMALLVTGVGALICVFAGGTLGSDRRFGDFLRGLLAFMAAMLGVVIADDLILLFAFWELTSITSFLLIGFHREREAARAAALRALLVTGAGGLALLAGLVLLGGAAGTFRISELLGRGELVRDHAWYPAILALVCVGCFTKSAQVPFHFWLPGAMEAPAPVSAYLHSSTMVKAGVFLLALLTPVLGGTPSWEWTLKLVGTSTMLVGAAAAVRATKLKKILAFTTVSALGTMVMLLGLGVPGDAAAMTFLLAHALYKGSLFMVAGVLEARTGEKDAERLGGLARRMPVTFAAAALAGLSLAGIPPLFGFAGKYLMKDSLTASPWTVALLVAVTGTGVAMTVAALMIALRPFRGPATDATASAQEAGASLLLGPVLLAGLSLVAGIAPGLFADPVVLAATDAVTGRPGDAELSSLHLFSLSAIAGPTGIALGGGVLLYAFRQRYRHATDRLRLPAACGGERIVDGLVAGALAAGRGQTRLLQHGSLTGYVRTSVFGLLLIGLWLLPGRFEAASLMPEDGSIRVIEAILVGVMVLAAVAATLVPHRLTSVAALGVVGTAAALLFVLFGAPDVAMTQFAIETLTVLILVLVFHHMPQFRAYTPTSRRIADWLLSLAFGAFMTVLMLLAIDTSMGSPISSYFSEQAVESGKGRNIVNVIIVDFRAADTFGELFVLALAGLGVWTLLVARRQADARKEPRP